MLIFAPFIKVDGESDGFYIVEVFKQENEWTFALRNLSDGKVVLRKSGTDYITVASNDKDSQNLKPLQLMQPELTKRYLQSYSRMIAL